MEPTFTGTLPRFSKTDSQTGPDHLRSSTRSLASSVPSGAKTPDFPPATISFNVAADVDVTSKGAAMAERKRTFMPQSYVAGAGIVSVHPANS